MRRNVPSLPPYWADEPAMFTDEDGIKRRRLWQRHPLPSGRLARIALAAYRPDPGLPDEERQPRPGHQGRWLLGIYIVTPADDIAARAAVMVWRRPDERFYVGDAAFAEFGVAAEAALDSGMVSGRQRRLRFTASRRWGGAVMAGPGDEITAAQGQGRGELRASDADREQVIELLKAAFVQGRLAKDEFDLRLGQAFAARTRAQLAAVTASLPAEPTTAKPPTPARTQIEPPVVRPGPLLAAATAVCAGVWMFGFLVPWPRDSEGDPPHGVALLVYLTTLIYLFVLAMTLWLGGAVMVESWLKRRSGGRRSQVQD